MVEKATGSITPLGNKQRSVTQNTRCREILQRGCLQEPFFAVGREALWVTQLKAFRGSRTA